MLRALARGQKRQQENLGIRHRPGAASSQNGHFGVGLRLTNSGENGVVWRGGGGVNRATVCMEVHRNGQIVYCVMDL